MNPSQSVNRSGSFRITDCEAVGRAAGFVAWRAVMSLSDERNRPRRRAQSPSHERTENTPNVVRLQNSAITIFSTGAEKGPPWCACPILFGDHWRQKTTNGVAQFALDDDDAAVRARRPRQGLARRASGHIILRAPTLK